MPREVRIENRFTAWRETARRLLTADLPPDQIVWTDNSSDAATLFEPLDLDSLAESHATANVSRKFLGQCEYVACHRDSEKWPLMYRLLWRMSHGQPHLMEIASDGDVHTFEAMYRAVSKDRHKMTAFMRFRKVNAAGEDAPPEAGLTGEETVAKSAENFVAWHRPDHFIVRLTAPFFRDRFASLRWTILTPDDSVSWDGHELCFGPGVPASAAPAPDELESLWKTYYGSIFNPARIKLKAMRREMPVRHWPTLPEAGLIDDLLRDAPKRVEEMVKRTARTNAFGRNSAIAAESPITRASATASQGALSGSGDAGRSDSADDACKSTGSARDFLPPGITLPQLRAAAQTCRGCDLYCHATQAVFGEGAREAFVMFVGEQPGDQEDLAGRPFIGPAGQLLDEVLDQVGIDRRNDVYVTNAVKHFKFEPRGKRRIHSKPNAREMAACRPWLEAEIQVVKPRMIVCLGATAAQSMLGAAFRITKHRGQVMSDQPWAPWMMATFHPSALLRMPDEAARHAAREDFTSDLRAVAKQIAAEKKIAR